MMGSTCATPHISLYFKAINFKSCNLMCTTPHISLYFKAINFKSWNLGGTCTPLSSDLGSVKII